MPVIEGTVRHAVVHEGFQAMVRSGLTVSIGGDGHGGSLGYFTFERQSVSSRLSLAIAAIPRWWRNAQAAPRYAFLALTGGRCRGHAAGTMTLG